MLRLFLSLFLCLSPTVHAETIWWDSILNIWKTPSTSQVVDNQGLPIANAEILIGYEKDQPFIGNYLFSNQNGEFEIPSKWSEPLPLTIMAQGYVRTTYLDQSPQARRFYVRPAKGNHLIELSGKTIGHSVVNNDNWADFGLTMPAMTKSELVSFDINAAISPITDSMDVVGNKISVPSNVSIPTQKERYIVNVTLSKPVYRMRFSDQQTKHITAMKGKFPFKSVVDKFRAGKQFYELINDFTIMGGGLYQIDLQSEKNYADLATDKFKFDEPLTARVPQYPSDQIVLASALGFTEGFYYPTDLKTVSSGGAVTLNTLKMSNPILLTVLKRKNEIKSGVPQRMSASLSSISKVAPVLLPLMDDPKVIQTYRIQIPVVNQPTSLNAIGQYLVLSSDDNPYWDVYGAKWSTEIELPPLSIPSIKSSRQWSVLLLASDEISHVELGPNLFEAVTHATQSTVQF